MLSPDARYGPDPYVNANLHDGQSPDALAGAAGTV
jgi:hypothetical protein